MFQQMNVAILKISITEAKGKISGNLCLSVKKFRFVIQNAKLKIKFSRFKLEHCFQCTTFNTDG